MFNFKDFFIVFLIQCHETLKVIEFEVDANYCDDNSFFSGHITYKLHVVVT